MTDKIFVDGLIVKRPDNAPDFATCKLSIKVAELVPFLEQNQNKGWVNIEVKRSKGGKYYAELDTWEPNRQEVHDNGVAQAKKEMETASAGSYDDTDIPFAPFCKGEFV